MTRAHMAAALLLAALAATPAAGQGDGAISQPDTLARPSTAPARRAHAASGPADPWLGEDKVRHLAASAALTGMAYGGARVALEPDGAIGVALGSAALAGLLREVHDYRLGKPFSFRDLAWDALGIVAGYLWIREIG